MARARRRGRRFVRNHASAVLAYDFFVTVTATFRVLYVFVVLEVGTRRILHWNVTEHPTAEVDGAATPNGGAGRTGPPLAHSRPRQHLFRRRGRHGGGHGSVDSQDADSGATSERLLRTPDWHNPNRGRPHASLGPGIPDHPPSGSASGLIGIIFLGAIASRRLRFWAGCITSTDWTKRRECFHTCRIQYLRRTPVRKSRFEQACSALRRRERSRIPAAVPVEATGAYSRAAAPGDSKIPRRTGPISEYFGGLEKDRSKRLKYLSSAV